MAFDDTRAMGCEEIIGYGNARSEDDLSVVAPPYLVADFHATHEIETFAREVERIDRNVILHRKGT